MKKFNLIIAFIFILLVKVSVGYSQYYDGYVVTNSNDTLKGYLLDESAYKNSTQVKFKSDLKDKEVKTYSPDEISSFVIGEEKIFVAFKKNQKLEKSLFLREVVTGPASLYQTNDKSGSPIFFIKKGDSEIIPTTKQNYYGLMKITLNECNKINYDDPGTRRETTYNKNRLENFINDYNNCLGFETKVASRNKVKRKISTGIKLGANYNDYQILYPGEQTGKYKNFAFAGGLFVNLPLSYNLSLKLEGLYVVKNGKGSRETSYEIFDLGYYVTTYKFSNHFLELPLLIEYKFSGSRFRPYINLGPSISYHTKTNSTASYDTSNYQGARPPSHDGKPFVGGPLFELSNFSVGFNSNFGFNLYPFDLKKPLILELRYSFNSLTTGKPPIVHLANVNSIAFLIGMEF